MEIRYSKIALKAIQGYDRPTSERIRSAIKGLTLIPPVDDIRPLVGKYGIYRLRVGKFRIKYEYLIGTNDGKILQIIDIDSRGDIYK